MKKVWFGAIFSAALLIGTVPKTFGQMSFSHSPKGNIGERSWKEQTFLLTQAERFANLSSSGNYQIQHKLKLSARPEKQAWALAGFGIGSIALGSGLMAAGSGLAGGPERTNTIAAGSTMIATGLVLGIISLVRFGEANKIPDSEKRPANQREYRNYQEFKEANK